MLIYPCNGLNLYHFNWGWNGSYNGYFALSNINPNSWNLSNNQAAIIGIKPNDGSTLVTNTTWSGNVTKNTHIAVPDAITLTVNPGAVIKFDSACKLQIWGKLSSIGTSTNYIKFTAVDTVAGWNGIKWENADGLDRMSDNDTSKLIYTQVEWSRNHGVYSYYYGKIIISHCKINNNDAGIWNGYNGQTNGYGGGLSIWYHNIGLNDCEIYNNHATIQGGGIFIISTDTLSASISHNDIHDNLSDIDGGGFFLSVSSHVDVRENIIHNNQATKGAGGALGSGSPSIVNNKFANNSTITSSGKGGGLYLENCNANVVNNLFANNTARSAAAIYFTNGSNAKIIGNTLSNNHSINVAGAIIVANQSNPSNPILKNTIIFGNTATNGYQIFLEPNCQPIFDHCDIGGGLIGFGGPGASGYNSTNYTNNIDSNPLFVSPSAGTGNGYNGLTANWSLQSTSSCVNAGDTTGVSNLLPSLDLAGNPRINGIIDMGAYEYGCQVPAQPSVITGNSNPCQTSSQVYSVTNVAGVTYTWAVPSGSTITAGQGTNSITVTIGATSGNISVTPGNSCGNGTARTLAITVNTVPAQPSVITGNSNPCQTSSQVYSVTNVAGVTYTWAFPSGSTITAGQGTNSITVTIGATSGNISVTPGNACGNGIVQNLSVSINPKPVTPVITQNFNQLISSSPLGNQWYNSNIGIINGAVSATYQPQQNGIYYCIVSLNNCSSDTSNKIHVINVGFTESNPEKIFIFPNPSFNGIFEIECESISSIEIFDNLGKSLLREKDAKIINLSNYAKGLYFAKISTSNGTGNYKLLVK